MLESCLSDYSDTCIHVKRTTTVQNTAVEIADTNNTNKKGTFKNYYSDYISEINNTQVDNAKYIDIVMLM